MEFNTINDFKKNFYEVYHKEVLPALKPVDVERVGIQKKAINFSILTIIAGAIISSISFFTGIDFLGFIGFIIFIGGMFIYPVMQKGFENKLKARLMPIMMKAFGNFSWTKEEVIDTTEIRTAKIFGRFDYRDVDDNFTGTYRNMPIEISETELYYETTDSKGNRSRHTTFKGALVSIGVGKNFMGHTIVRTRALLGNMKTYQEVKLEDPEFSKMFYVDSNDQVESRYILTTAFMERFKRISNAFGAKHPECSFKDGKILIALSTYKDLFKLGNLNTPVTDTKQFQIFMNEIISILEMIDFLKITDKTGL